MISWGLSLITYFADARKAYHLTLEHLGKRLVGNAVPYWTPPERWTVFRWLLITIFRARNHELTREHDVNICLAMRKKNCRQSDRMDGGGENGAWPFLFTRGCTAAIVSERSLARFGLQGAWPTDCALTGRCRHACQIASSLRGLRKGKRGSRWISGPTGGRIFLKGKLWWISYSINGKERRESLFTIAGRGQKSFAPPNHASRLTQQRN